MAKRITPQTGYVYYLKNFKHPHVFTGRIFECLQTDQSVAMECKITIDTGTHIRRCRNKIWKPERFNYLVKEKQLA